ncbi:discoidin domain-containing protein [Paenibacillus sp. JCM 10914]|uniref:discoidin domain-containing protein n=1 Tax=Paenibacillus sp. JCM 10914 TaxID=1236974 RepID=UPI001E2A938C|nr:discoidin domain-containing protein [Paenibacillus sp. JCM 10914]
MYPDGYALIIQLSKAEEPDGDTISWSLVAPPSYGTVRVDEEGTYQYTPINGYLGYDQFRVAAEDDHGGRTESDMLVYVGPTAEHLAASLRIQDGLDSISGGRHPRLLASTEDLNQSRLWLDNGDRYMSEWMDRLRRQADPVLSTTPLSYSPNGGNVYMLRDRLIPTALMYRFTGESRYAQRVWQELEAMTHYEDWGGRTNNILALSELSFAVALAYDWIYDDLDQLQRAQLNTAIKDHALAVALDWYRGEFRHNGEHNNINLVDNGGLGLLALAVADEPETEAQALEVIQSTFQKLQYALRHYTEDGAWPEGPAYWHYGGQYLAMYIQALNTSMGTDFGLSLLPGYAASGAYPYHLLGEGGFFNFYDGNISYNMYESLWFASFFDKPEYAWFIGDLYNRKGYFHPLYMVFYKPGMFEQVPTQLDRFFTGIESASMRSAWDDPYALFASIKGVNETMRSHNDLDGGTFVFDALGVRWASDLGNESYSLPGFWDYQYQRWTYYRKKTEGHNTLVINPIEHPVIQQEPYGTAVTLKKESKPRGAYTILDLSDLYRKDASEMLRGMKLSSDRRELVIQDEIQLKQPSELYWFMHTGAEVEITEDGRAAILYEQDKRLYVQMTEAPTGARFSVMDARPLATSPNPEGQSSNEGMRKLTIHLQQVQDIDLSVRMIPLYAHDPLPNDETDHIALLEWSIPDGELPEVPALPVATALMLDGVPLQDYRPEITYYEAGLPFDAPQPPLVSAETEHTVTINQASSIPGSATITIQDKDNPKLSNRYTLHFTRNPAIGEPPNHLKYQVQQVTASSVPESTNIPEHVIDGNLDTRWSASGKEYVQLDLGEPRSVGAVSLAIYLGDTRKNLFDVLASVDGVEWSTIYENGLTSGTTQQPETFLVEPTTARYIRILGKGNNVNPWNSFTEVGVYPLAPIVLRIEAVPELKLGESKQMNGWYGFPGGKREQAEALTYISDAPDVIQVSAAGRLTAITPGTAIITIQDSVYGLTETVKITAQP